MKDKIWTDEEFEKLSDKEINGCFKFCDGNIFWYKNGEFHRDDGPAIEWASGDKTWYKEGKLHRLDGPACEEFDDGILYKYYAIEDEPCSEERFKILSFAILNNLKSFL